MPGRKKPQALRAFIPIGIALFVLGLSVNPAFIGAGSVFLIVGLTAVLWRRYSDDPEKTE